jgi:hypothetical protein
MDMRRIPFVILLACAPAVPGAAGDADASFRAPADLAFSTDRFNIAVLRDGKVKVLTDTNRDFKPVSSPDGKHLVFFRVRTYGNGTFETWRTVLCTIGTDGTGFREHTSGEFADYNPTFTRDGTNRIVFNRYNRAGTRASEIYMTTVGAAVGAEKMVSHPTSPAYEWAYSTLRDGRLFIHRFRTPAREVYLLTPNPGGLGKYERVEMPSNQYFHKACISPSETKIAYMYDNDNDGATYNDVQIAWAKLDLENLRVHDQKFITPDDRRTIDEYPKWSPDETMVLYDSNKVKGGGDLYGIYACRIADGVERLISPDPGKNFQFACVLGLPH